MINIDEFCKLLVEREVLRTGNMMSPAQENEYVLGYLKYLIRCDLGTSGLLKYWVENIADTFKLEIEYLHSNKMESK